jgi:hypothetical protein
MEKANSSDLTTDEFEGDSIDRFKKLNINEIILKNNFQTPEKSESINLHNNYSTLYKSTDFNPKELEESAGSTINNIRNQEYSINDNSIKSTKKYILQDHLIPSLSDIKNIILLRNTSLINLVYFVQNYIQDLNSFFCKIDAIILKRATSILDKNKYFIRFFKELTALYETFSLNLIQANNTINLHFKDEEENSPFSWINESVDKVQEIISNNFYDFSRNLQSKILLKGPLSKMRELYIKMGNIAKESQQLLSKITIKRDKLIQKSINFEKLIENFKKCFNDKEKLLQLFDKNEFFLIEFQLCNSVNKIFLNVEQFLKNYRKFLNDLKGVIKEFVLLLAESIQIYSVESKTFCINNQTNSTSNTQIEGFISFSNIIENLERRIQEVNVDSFLFDFDSLFHRNENCKTINEQLKSMQLDMLKFTFVKNENIYQDECFKIEKYKNFDELIEFFIELLPAQCEIMNSNLLIFSCTCRKISGFFNSSKKCVLAVTNQNSLLIFDDKINIKTFDKLLLKNIKFRNIEDKKHPLRFELSELKVGLIYNSTFKIILEAENEESYKQIETFLMNSIVNI